jgi:2TM domain
MELAKIQPTAKQRSLLLMHLAAFIIVNAILWFLWMQKEVPADGFKYPIHIWMTSAWALSLVAHWAALYTNKEDKGMDMFKRDAAN